MLLLLLYCWPLGHQVALLFGNWQLAMGIEDGGDDDDDDDDDDGDDDDYDGVCLFNNFCRHFIIIFVTFQRQPI